MIDTLFSPLVVVSIVAGFFCSIIVYAYLCVWWTDREEEKEKAKSWAAWKRTIAQERKRFLDEEEPVLLTNRKAAIAAARAQGI